MKPAAFLLALLWSTAAADQIKDVGMPTYRFTTFHQCIEDRCTQRTMLCLNNKGYISRITESCYKRVWGPCIKTCRALSRKEKWRQYD